MSEGSNSAAEICEICENEKVKCLCDVKLNHNNKMYHWQGGNEIFNPEDLQSFIGLKEVKVDYVIKGCCEDKNDQCTKLFHYPTNDEKKIEWKSSKRGSGETGLLFKFEKEGISPPKVLNEASQEPFFRMIDFVFLSRTSLIPHSSYHVGVIECVDGEIPEPVQKGKANFGVEVYPNYKVEGKLEIDLAGKGNLTWNNTSVIKTEPTWDLALDFKLKEFINDEDGAEYNLDLIALSSLSKYPVFQWLSYLQKWVSGFNLFNIPLGPVSIELTPPKITLETTATLKEVQGSGEGALIERSNTKVTFQPLMGVAITLDVIDALLIYIPPIRILYKRAKYNIAKVTSIKVDSKRGTTEVNDNRAFQKALERTRAANKKDGWFVDAKFVIWADISLKFSINGDVEFLGSSVGILPELELNSADIKAALVGEMGAQFKIQFVIFEATLTAKLEVEAGFVFKFCKEFVDKTNKNGNADKGDGTGYDFVIEYTGFAVKWSIDFAYGFSGEKDGNSMGSRSDKIIDHDNQREKEKNQALKENGFFLEENGKVIMDEDRYEQPMSSEEFGAWYASSVPAFGGTVMGINSSGFKLPSDPQRDSFVEYQRFLTETKQARKDYQDNETGQHIFTEKRVLYPEYRSGIVR